MSCIKNLEKNTLLENSECYYGMNSIYEEFSKAEDFPKFIQKFLVPKLKNKIVLDLGCGTGKFLEVFVPISKEYYGLDLSRNQLDIANKKSNKAKLICSSAESIPLEDNSIDVVIATWVVGTIPEKNRRLKVLDEVKRVLRDGGVAYFVENSEGGEFEELRRRLTDDRTKKYNDFLKENCFYEIKKFDSYFKFESIEKANEIFRGIWGNVLTRDIFRKTVDHKISIFEYRN